MYKGVILFVLLWIFFVPNGEADSYYVKPTGNDTASGTNWATAWKTIQKSADTMSSGDTTYISNGVYSETVEVTSKTSLSFVGYGDTVKLTGHNSTNYFFKIKDSESIQINNFDISSNTNAMIFFTNSNHCIVKNNIIHDNNLNHNLGAGIKLVNCNYNEISKNLIYNIEAPITTGHCYGIYLYNSHTNSIISNEIKESGSGFISGGADIWCHGIYILNSDNNYIRYNHLHDMDHYGIEVVSDNSKSAPYTFLNNKILDNTLHGMDVAITTHELVAENDSLRGQVIGRNKIWNTGKGIIWHSSTPCASGEGGWCYKNSVTSKQSNYNYLQAFNFVNWPKIKFYYNSARGYYDGVSFQNYDYAVYNIAMGSNYRYNINQDAGGTSQSINYSCTQSGKVGAGVSAGTGNINGAPLFVNKSNTRLQWNSLCIGKASPGPDGVRGCIGAHTSFIRAYNDSANNITTYTLVFVTSPYDGAIPNDGKIKVEFPSGFNFISPSIVSHNFDGPLSISIDGSIITFTRTGGNTFPTNRPFRIIFNGVNNSGYNGDDYYCIITIMSNNGTVIEKEDSNNFRIINGIDKSSAPHPWPMYAQNQKHTGWTNKNVPGIQRKPFTKWFYDSSFIYGSPAIGLDETVYIADGGNKVYAITNGKKKWQYELNTYVRGSPVLGYDNTVYVADYGNKLYAIRNGTLIWSFQISNSSFHDNSPIVGDDGTIYVGDIAGNVYAVTNGKLKWSCWISGFINGSSPAVDTNGTVYIDGSWPQNLYAITNGAVKWAVYVTNKVYSSPTIGNDGTIYLANYNGLFAITNGSIKWYYPIGESTYTSPAVDDNNIVYVGTIGNRVYAISNGVLKWSFTTNNDFNSSPSIGSDGTIYIGNYNHKIYALTNGAVKWSYDTGNTIYYSTPAIASDGTIYIGNSSGLYAIGEKTPPILVWSSNTGYSNDGVSPNTNYGGAFFKFEIKYVDEGNDAPSTNQVWVDINDDGSYQDNEKFQMYFSSGTDYSNGVIYTNKVQVFSNGDGIINYKFYFRDEYGLPPITNTQISNHTLTVTNTSLHILTVTKNTDFNNYFESFSNQTVMALRIWDSHGDTLKGFKIGNAGVMTQGKQINKVELWYDSNTNFVWDSGDTFVTNLNWDNTGLWTNNNINFATTLEYPHYNYIVTVDLTTNVKKGDYFKSYIPANGIKCSGNLNAPSYAITNTGNVEVGQYLFLKSFGTGVGYSSIVLGDIDNDGDLDLIATGYNGVYRLDKYINDGNGNFSASSFGTGVYYSSIALGDIDNDGDLDLIVTGYDSSWNERLDKYINDGTGNFTNSVTAFGTGVEYSSIALGDIDNDGNLDLIVTGYDGSGYRLDKYINDGTGNFLGPGSFGTGVYDSSIALGDIDNDGDLDLIVTGHSSSGYRLDKYINGGNGNFSASSFGTGVYYSSIALGDIDNDGDLDLIVTGYDGNERILNSYLNDYGNFKNKKSFGTGVYSSSIALGDITGNNNLDLIVTGRDDSFNYRLDNYLNMESINNSGPSVPVNLHLESYNGYWLLKWDKSSDDHTSLLMMQYHVAIGITTFGVYDYISTNINYPRGQANIGNVCIVKSNFYQTTIATQSPIYWKVSAIDTSFKYSDYSIESYSTNKGAHILTVTLNTDINTNYSKFQLNTLMSFRIADTYSHYLNSLKIGNADTMAQGTDIDKVLLWQDANNDYNYDSEDIYIGELIWNGTYWSNANLTYGIGCGRNFILTVDFAKTANLTNFFKPYIPAGGVSCNSNTNAPITAITNNGLVGIREGFIGPNSGIIDGYNAPSFALGDIDNDGDLDLVGCGYPPKILFRQMNLGNGEFQSRVSFGQGGDRGSLALGDIDNDGDLDLIMTSAGNLASRHYFDRYLNDGTGNFTSRTSIYGTDTEGLCDSAIALGDMDGDGDLDIIATGSSTISHPDARLEYYTNYGNGTFSSRCSFGTGVYSSAVAIGDLDNDGDMDVVVAGYDGSSKRLDKYINDGTGNFTATAFGTPVSGTVRCGIALGDINNDGWLDIIVAGDSANNTLFGYINNKDGTFSQTNFGAEIRNGPVLLGDIDQDGDLDLVACGSMRLDKYFNSDGTGPFDGPHSFGQGLGYNYSADAVFGDIDNDGDLDLIAAGATPTIVGDVYFNIHHIVNTASGVPNNTSFTSVNGYFRLKWSAPADDHTAQSLLRYKIAFGTNTSGVYDVSSESIDYPRGQANEGNVTIVTGCYFQTKITNTKTIYWRVCAIDTSLKPSLFSSENIATYRLVHNLTRDIYYINIMSAVNDASNGNHLQANSYVYNENVEINNFTNLILETTSFASNGIRTNTFIIPKNASLPIVKISNSKNILFQGFLCKNGTNGIFIIGGYANKINNNIICSNEKIGVYMDSSSNNIIKSNNIINNNWYGIRIGNKSYSNEIAFNQILTNKREGLYINNSDMNVIYSNFIVGNVFEGVLIESNSKNNKISKNVISYNTNGIRIYNSSSNTIVSNNIFKNKTEGINIIKNGSYNKISFNKIYSNTYQGVRIVSNANNTEIAHNNIWTNGDGVKLEELSFSNTIASNNIFNNYWKGIYITYSSHNSINSNFIHNNIYEGILVENNSHKNIITNNIINKNNEGIKITDSDTNDIIYNNFSTNNFQAIRLINSRNSVVSHNTIITNGEGIKLDGNCNDISIVSNMILHSKWKGIYLISSTNCRITGNKVYTNGDIGVLSESSSFNNYYSSNIIAYNNTGIKIDNSTISTLYRNAVYNNKQYGIYLNNSANNSIINNSLCSNEWDGMRLEGTSSGNIIKNTIVGFSKSGFGINIVGGSATITYSDIYGNTSGEYGGSAAASTGCISENPLWLSYNIYSSDFLYLNKYSQCVDAGDPADAVPPNGGPYIDIGWKEYTRPYVILSITKFITNVKLGGVFSTAIPGASIEYKIEYKVRGNVNASNIIIYDKIPYPFVTYSSDYMGTASGWTTEYSTNENPVQTFSSADYKTNYTSKEYVKWLRWKKTAEGNGTKTLFYEVIIK